MTDVYKKHPRIFTTESGQDVIVPNVVCDSSVFLGAFVYLDSSSVAYNAIATSLVTANVFGLVESKESTTSCSVRVLGISSALFAGLDVTKEYYLSDTVAGEITFATIGSGHVVIKLGQPYSATRLLVLKGIPTLKG